MKKLLWLSPSVRSEHGTAMLEFAIVLPFLVFTVFSGIETARALRNYLTLSQVAYEGVRYAASLPGLEVGKFDAANVPGSTSQQARVRRIIDEILVEYELSTSAAEVTSEHLAVIADGGPDNRVTIQISANYVPLFSFGFPSIPIQVTATSPYLYPST